MLKLFKNKKLNLMDELILKTEKLSTMANLILELKQDLKRKDKLLSELKQSNSTLKEALEKGEPATIDDINEALKAISNKDDSLFFELEQGTLIESTGLGDKTKGFKLITAPKIRAFHKKYLD